MKIYYKIINNLIYPVPDSNGNDITGLTEYTGSKTIVDFYTEEKVLKCKDDGVGGVEDRTQTEIDDDIARLPVTSQTIQSKIFDEYGDTGDWTDVKAIITDNFLFYLNLCTTAGYIEAKALVDASTLSTAIKTAIKGFIPKTD